MRLPEKDRRAMMALIEQWQKSGMRQKDFYRQHNIPAHVFYYWHKCYRKQQQSRIIKSSLSSNSFIELQPSGIEPVNNIEIRFPNGIQIFLNTPVSVDYLKALTR
jgi:transposase-like protein